MAHTTAWAKPDIFRGLREKRYRVRRFTPARTAKRLSTSHTQLYRSVADSKPFASVACYPRRTSTCAWCEHGYSLEGRCTRQGNDLSP